MGKKSGSGSGINNPDHISVSLETFFDADPGSGMEKIRLRDKHSGSATMRPSYVSICMLMSVHPPVSLFTVPSVPVPLHSLFQLWFQEKKLSMTNHLVFLPCPVPTFPVSSKLRSYSRQCFGSGFIDSGSGSYVLMTKNCKNTAKKEI